jgi:hypothetical protein
MQSGMEEIKKTLAKCEREIREVIASAAQAGDYETVDRGRKVALQISALLSNSEPIQNERSAEAPRRVSNKSRTKGAKHQRASEYPRFEISGLNLIRFGWSKKAKREYHHKVPKTAYLQVLHTISSLGNTNQGPLTAESILEKANEESEDPIPNYQVYAVLGFLKGAQAIEQQGREGYIIPADFSDRSSNCWI